MRFLKRIKIFQCILAFSLDDRYVEALQLQIIADRPFNLREASFINKHIIVTVGGQKPLCRLQNLHGWTHKN